MTMGEEVTPNPVAALEEKISNYQAELDRLRNQKNFPYVYIVVAIPTTLVFLFLSLISEGLIDITTAITGALFFSLLITCSYLVVFQPSREELLEDLNRKIKNLQREKAKLEAGLRGEREVAYILKWLPKDYITINNLVIPSRDYEPQQIDHLVLGPNGIFHIETKSINGFVIIGEKGEWVVIKAVQNRMVKEGMENPRGQLERHDRVIRDMLHKVVPPDRAQVIPILVMANPQTIVEGEEPGITVIKKDRLLDFIRQYPCKAPLSAKQIRKLALFLAINSLENPNVEETSPGNER